MTWIAVLPALLMGLVCLLGPGLLIGWLATIRGTSLWGLAPLLSCAAFTVLLLVFGLSHVGWNAVSVGVGMLAVVVVVALVRMLITRSIRSPRRAKTESRRMLTFMLIGAAIALVLVGVRFAIAFGEPSNIAQTFDTNFHLNGIKYILATGDANPLTFSSIAYDHTGTGSFYPNLWHGLTSVVVQLSGSPVTVSANAMSILIGGVVWPLSMLYFVRQLLGARPVVMIVTGIAASAFAAFPLSLVEFGVLYPNLLSLALVPVALGALLSATRMGRDPDLPVGLSWLVLATTVPTLSMAQPNGLISMLVLAVPVLGVAGWHWVSVAWRSGTRGAFVGRLVVVLAAAVALLAVFVSVRPLRSAANWPPTLGMRRAAFNAVINAQLGAPAIAVSIFVVVGVVAVFVMRRHRWLVASAIIIEVIYVATAALPIGDARYWLSGTWYSDVNRIIATAPIVLVPLVVIGVVAATRWVTALLGRVSGASDHAQRGKTTVGIAMVALLLLGTQVSLSMTHETQVTAEAYRFTPHARLVSTDERALLRRVPREVPAGSIVAGNPWTGTSMVWALSDRRALLPNIRGAVTPTMSTVLESLRDAGRKPGVCEAIAAEHVRFVLDFGKHGVFGKTQEYPGVTNLAGSDAVTLVDHVGAAALYRVTACP